MRHTPELELADPLVWLQAYQVFGALGIFLGEGAYTILKVITPPAGAHSL